MALEILRIARKILFPKNEKISTLGSIKKDAFILEAEIVELKDKPSLPWGTVGADSYGNKPVFTDRGPTV